MTEAGQSLGEESVETELWSGLERAVMDPGLQMEMLKPFGGWGYITMTSDGENRFKCRKGAGQCCVNA